MIIHFPDNKLNVTIEQWFNGHLAAICQNTDTIQTDKYQLAELEAFRNNIQLTAFVDPVFTNKSAYINLISSGRVSSGDYFQTDLWYNDVTGQIETIPDYYATTWTQAGVDVFGVVLGSAKLARTPNHGQQLYDVSNGKYGYNVAAQVIGQSNLSELKKLIDWHREWNGLQSSFSWRNGRNEGAPVIIPYYIGGRNSWSSSNGDSVTGYPFFIRLSDVDRNGSTRTHDAKATLGSLAASIDYTKTQIQKAINERGFFNDFIHWHSIYNGGIFSEFAQVFAGFSSQIGNQDVWRCGYGEALEYAYLRDFVDLFSSRDNGGSITVNWRIKDKYKGTFTNTIDNDVNERMFNTPISFRISTSGTSLAGKSIKCETAELIRKIDNNTWIVSIPLVIKKDENVQSFTISEGLADYYDETVPSIAHIANTFTSDVPVKWVVWRKPYGESLGNIREVVRYNEYRIYFEYLTETGYNYYIGAISKFGHSSLKEV